MKSVVESLLRTGSAKSNRSNASNNKFVWKQSPDGKWFKVSNRLQAANVDDIRENPLYTPEVTPNSFVCGVCSAPMHYRVQDEIDEDFRCSICDVIGFFNTVQLTCDSCELYVCCKATLYSEVGELERKWKPSCYDSYYDKVEAVREELYNRQEYVSQLSIDIQQRWLQCMWQDSMQNMNRFCAELHRASQVEAIDDTNASMIVENLGMGMTKSLVRLFVIFHSKFDSDIVKWFSSLIKHRRELFGVALQTCVKLKGRLEQLKWLVQGLSLNASNCEFSEAVRITARMGKLDILEYFLEDVGVDPTADENVALQSACRNGHLNVVDRLLQDDRVDPSEGDNAAIRIAGRVEVVELLLQDDRVDPSAKNNYAIGQASHNGYLSVVERLLQDVRVDPSANNNYALRLASHNGHLNIVERLLQDVRVDPSARDNAAIRRASHDGHLSIVERLLQDDRVDPSADDNHAIREASSLGHVDVVERLLQDDRVDPSADDNAAIQYASFNGDLSVVEQLLQDDRVDPSADDNDAIRYASRNGCLNVVERLLQDDRVDPSADDNYAIREASSNGHLNVVERLLQDDRVDPSADDNYAIQEASSNGHLNVVERLLQDGRVDPSARDNEAIRRASSNGHLNVVERLLQDDRVDPSADDNGAIRWASERASLWYNLGSRDGRVNVVKRLLQDDRVDPVALGCQAIRSASDDQIIKCLYDRTRSIACFMIDDEELMQKLTPLHNESLVMGGLCLNQAITGTTSTTTLPQDVIFLILSEWASLNLIAMCDD